MRFMASPKSVVGLITGSMVLTALAGVVTAEPNMSSMDPLLRPRGTYKVVDNPGRLRFGPGPRHRVLYVNGGGGIFTPGVEDSCANTSSIATSQSAMPPSGLTSQQWSQLMT